MNQWQIEDRNLDKKIHKFFQFLIVALVVGAIAGVYYLGILPTAGIATIVAVLFWFFIRFFWE